MKPIVIYFPVDNEKIYMTKTELEDLIEKVYEQGKADGRALEKPIISYPVPFPQYPVSPWYVPSPDSTAFPQITWGNTKLCSSTFDPDCITCSTTYLKTSTEVEI